MRQIQCGKRGERRVLSYAEQKDIKQGARKILQDARLSEQEKERLVAEGKMRKIVIREGNSTRYRFEEI